MNYIGFEPDERSSSELVSKKNYCKNYTIYKYVVSDAKGDINLNFCRKPQVSSIYTPNKKFINLFPDSIRFDVLEKKILEAKKLDDINIYNPDFVKLDIQGGELKALFGGKKTIESSFGLELEVEFLPLYDDQPLFGDISSFLSKKGFEFIDFVNLCRWERDSHSGFGQCIFGDALYLKPPEIVINQNKEISRISSYLAILLLYKRFDLIRRVFELLPENHKSAFSTFQIKVNGLEATHKRVRNFSIYTSRFLRIFEPDSRNYLLY